MSRILYRSVSAEALLVIGLEWVTVAVSSRSGSKRGAIAEVRLQSPRASDETGSGNCLADYEVEESSRAG